MRGVGGVDQKREDANHRFFDGGGASFCVKKETGDCEVVARETRSLEVVSKEVDFGERSREDRFREVDFKAEAFKVV